MNTKNNKNGSSNQYLFITASVVATIAAQWLLRHIRRNRNKEQTATLCCEVAPRRFGGAIQLRPDMYNLYTQLHDRIWDQVLERLQKSNIRNFTIYYHPETSTLFSHFEWIGNVTTNGDKHEEERRFKEDMNAIATDKITREWWSYCEPCQKPFSQWPAILLPPSQQHDPTEENWWAPLICVAHCGYWPIQYANSSRDPEFIPRNPFGRVSTREKPPQNRNISHEQETSIMQ